LDFIIRMYTKRMPEQPGNWHTGGNPNFRTEAILFPKEERVCLLTSGANTNVSLAMQIKAVLDGDLAQMYRRSGTQYPYRSVFIGLISSMHSMVCMHFLTKGFHTKASSTRCRNLSGAACFLCAVSFIPILVCLFRRFRRRSGRGELLRQLFE